MLLIIKTTWIGFKPPKSILFTKDAHENFWRSLEIYMSATGLIDKDDPTRVAILLSTKTY